MVNRNRISNELSRRYQEVVRLAGKRAFDDKQAERFLTAVAHYLNYAKNNKLTRAAIDSLSTDKDIQRKDNELCKKADSIINQMRADRDELIKEAKKKGVDVDAYKFQVGMGRITGEQEFSFYLNHLNSYLDLPSDQQGIGELPGNILNLVQLINELVNGFGETKKFKELKGNYLKKRNAFEQELKVHGVHLDYVRFEDYKHLDVAWKEIYQQGTSDELLLFHLEYGHLFEKNVSYSGGQQSDADRFIDDYTTYTSRFHNHLIDHIENVPVHEEFAIWFVEHFGPTFISVLIIFFILLMVNWLTGGGMTYQEVKELIP
ncbi:MAG: hypothetical protein ABIQ89_02665 [Candidatus Saccharimonadales bacterium]